MKKALITGITGQDGSYLAELLLAKGYEVHGLRRRGSLHKTDRIDHLYQDPHITGTRMFLHYGDLSDGASLASVLSQIRPDEVYNLAAQSHVAVSFETPEYTGNADGIGTLRLLETIRLLGLRETTRFYQASTSELYGAALEIPQTEKTPFNPRSPYAVAKLYGHWITVNYREAYNLFAVSGILFNHESPRRGETFVTRKITRGLTRMALGLQDTLYLGNLNAKRDWGHARDFVEAQWLMLQQNEPEDFVIATGEQHSVRSFCEKVAGEMGVTLEWRGVGTDEVGIVAAVRDKAAFTYDPGHVAIRIDPGYFRPTEVETLLGDASKAREKLNWQPRTTFQMLVEEMVRKDLELATFERMKSNTGA